jgi:hypothetical protein
MLALGDSIIALVHTFWSFSRAVELGRRVDDAREFFKLRRILEYRKFTRPFPYVNGHSYEKTEGLCPQEVTSSHPYGVVPCQVTAKASAPQASWGVPWFVALQGISSGESGLQSL